MPSATALDELGAVDPRLALVVDLKFFCGFSFVEIAAMQGLTDRTVQRDWEKARIFLLGALRRDELPADAGARRRGHVGFVGPLPLFLVGGW